MGNTKILFETYLHTVDMSQDVFMIEYKEAILPLLENKNIKPIHFRLKELARASELIPLPYAQRTLDKLHHKASLVLESNKFALVDRMHKIGIEYPNAASITAAMITTAIAENKNPEYVLVPGMKVLHRAFLSEANFPDGYTFETEGGARYQDTQDGWLDLNTDRIADESMEERITSLARKAYEEEQSTIPEETTGSEIDEPEENIDAAVPVGYSMEAEDGSIWKFNGKQWSNAETGDIIEDDDINQSISDIALAHIAQSDGSEDELQDELQDDSETFDIADDEVAEPEVAEPEVQAPKKEKQHRLPKSTNKVPRGYEFTAPNGTELRWAGAMWQYKNENGKYIPVPKKHKESVVKLLQHNIDQEAEKRAELARKTHEEKQQAQEKKQQEISTKFDFSNEITEPEPEPEIEDVKIDDIEFDEPEEQDEPEKRTSDQPFPVGYTITSNAGTEYEYLGDGIWGNNTTNSYVENTALANKITQAATDDIKREEESAQAAATQRAEEEETFKQDEAEAETFGAPEPKVQEPAKKPVPGEQAKDKPKTATISPSYERPSAERMDVNDPRRQRKTHTPVKEPASRPAARAAEPPAIAAELHPDLVSVLDDMIARRTINNRNTKS